MNWISFSTHFKREFQRFFTVPHTTIYPQLLVVFFYMLIFGIAIGSRIREVHGYGYLLFILPGLLVQNIINGSYSNPSGSLFVARSMGFITDILLAPLSYAEMITGYLLAGILRGFFLGIGTLIIALFFIKVHIAHPFLLLLYLTLIAYVFAGLGIIIGLVAKEWQELNIFINFVVTPLTFLGGVFYSLDMVPPLLAALTRWNPLFAMIDGTRYAMIGVHDASIYAGVLYLVILSILITSICLHLFRIGYRMRT